MASESYDPTAFQRLPLITDAVKAFDAIGGDDLVSGSFRDLFLRYQMDHTFGLALLHRHFDLEADERLVEYRGTSVPWRQDRISKGIQPSSWLLTDGTLRPYEFHYGSPSLNFTDPAVQAFIQAFDRHLDVSNAQGLFGLCVYPGDDFNGRVEITEGRANINLEPKDYPANMESRTAAWFYSPPLWNAKCNCGCRFEGPSHSGEHNGHRETT